ncbi:hypothetical protein B0H10DRAFT_2094553 [Mycena sp. CBHHK59/15]|nr:hypothetical protein B0H10DRAFT_2094553 [Mycena sp. CBHHK59/15]
MASPLAHTFGIWLVALFLQAILYGMGLLQIYLYFFWYNKDRWSIKATTVQISTFFSAAWSWLIDGFGDFNNLRFFSWQALAQLAALYTSTFVAQTIILPAVIVTLSLVGLAQVILAVKLKTFDQLPHTSAATNTQAAVALTCDLLITVGLCWRLNNNRTGIQSTNKLLNFLITTAINRGVLTMITALMNMILFLTQPGTFYFMLSLLIMYMNSMLAMLNTRQHAVSLHGSTMVDHISMPTLSSTSGTASRVIGVSDRTETRNDRDVE